MSLARRSRGFTLIEVMVAFAIFALTVGAVFEVFAGATRRAERATGTEQLWLTAQSVLSELRVRAAPWPSEDHGNDSTGQSWTVAVVPFDAGTNPESQWRAYLVSVRVESAATKREVTLKSVELARAAP